MSSAVLRRLFSLLDQEHGALRRADIPALERLMPRKLRLLDRIEATPIHSAQEAEQLRALASRNARLFAALQAGVQQARTLLAQLCEGTPRQTYARNGQRALLDPPQGRLERKA